MDMVRICTSPPSNYDFAPEEGSYYCDIHESADGTDLEIISTNKNLRIFPGLDKTQRIMLVTEHLFDTRYKEIGALIEFVNEEGELMYFGIDHRGSGRAEASINEAAWHIANAGQDLPDDHTLSRVPPRDAKG